jgi:hypothetical protein
MEAEQDTPDNPRRIKALGQTGGMDGRVVKAASCPPTVSALRR